MRTLTALAAALSVLAIAGAAAADPVSYSDMKKGEMDGHHTMGGREMGRHHMRMHHRMHHRMMRHHDHTDH